MEPGLPLLLALGPPAGLLCGHLAGEASALARPLLLSHTLCPDLCTPLPASPVRLPALCLARLRDMGPPSDHPTAIPVHVPKVRTAFLGPSLSTVITACVCV